MPKTELEDQVGQKRSPIKTWWRETTRTPSARMWRYKSGGGSDISYANQLATLQGRGGNPQGQRRAGRLKQAWRRSGEIKTKTRGLTWAQLNKTDPNRVCWYRVIAALILHQGTYRNTHSKHKLLGKGHSFVAVVSNKKKQSAFQTHSVITCCEFWSLGPCLTEWEICRWHISHISPVTSHSPSCRESKALAVTLLFTWMFPRCKNMHTQWHTA